MKKILLLAAYFLLIGNFSKSEEKKLFANTNDVLDPGYYLVIGAYSKNSEYWAKRYTGIVNKMGHEAAYGFSPKKNLYFVYLTYTENFKEALADLRQYRKIEEFNDCWIYVMGVYSGDKSLPPVATATDNSDTKPDNAKEPDAKNSISNDTEKTDDKATSGDGGTSNEEKITEKKASDDTPKKDQKQNGISALSKKVFFNTYHSRNSNLVDSEIQIIDLERSKLNGAVKSNKAFHLTDPKNGTGKLILLCDVFGYRRMQHEFNYYSPDTTLYHTYMKGDTLMVSFDLVRYTKGDIATLFNVYFYKDASIMRPESKYELNLLHEMLTENKNYKIKIHGHTNGNAPGKIVSLKDGSNNYFTLKGNSKDGFGSAKELSRQRAEIIKNYLVDKGIASERMEIKAWGGKRMLHSKVGEKAKKNVRVEVEVLEN